MYGPGLDIESQFFVLSGSTIERCMFYPNVDCLGGKVPSFTLMVRDLPAAVRWVPWSEYPPTRAFEFIECMIWNNIIRNNYDLPSVQSDPTLAPIGLHIATKPNDYQKVKTWIGNNAIHDNRVNVLVAGPNTIIYNNTIANGTAQNINIGYPATSTNAGKGMDGGLNVAVYSDDLNSPVQPHNYSQSVFLVYDNIINNNAGNEMTYL